MVSNFTSLKIGILGGGQLGKMLALAGADWNLDISVLDPTVEAPASSCAKQSLGSFKDSLSVVSFGEDKDLITIEIEDVSIEGLEILANQGKKIYPQVNIIKLIQDKGFQKAFYKGRSYPSSEFVLAENASEIKEKLLMGILSFPFVQKLRKAGYDGKGVQIIHSTEDLPNLFNAPSVLEKVVKIHKEISVLACRSAIGEIKIYEPVEMVFHPSANILLYQECPASIDLNLQKEVQKLAENLISDLDMVGLLAIEMFIDLQGHLLINEIAPRPHNSGHHTIEAAITSQYHQLWRAVLGLPLGSCELRSPSVMINLLGTPGHSGIAKYEGIESCLSLPDVYIHLYGKKQTHPYRKMGHVTILANDMEQAKERASYIQKNLNIVA